MAQHPELFRVDKLSEYVANVDRQCSLWHDEFDHLRENRQSYHNKFHISSAQESARRLVRASTDPFNFKDPLGLRNQLDTWNKIQAGNNMDPVSMEEFRYLVDFAFAVHDLGNIAETVQIWDTKKGGKSFDLLYHKRNGKYAYKAEGAEERAIRIAQTILKNSAFAEKEKERYIELVSHLINETYFNFNSLTDKPLFATFMRIVDQIGSTFVLHQNGITQEMIDKGLDEEYSEEWGTERKKEYSGDFISWRFPQLMPYQNLREQIEEVLRN